jgi:serine/threonine protein kinase
MALGSSESDAGASRPLRRLGRYTLLKRVAKGGMGEVLLAATSGIEGAERPVIVKMIREEHRTDASFRARFLDEARVQAQLSHSGVASILDATTDEATGEPYVVVEHVDGRNLGDVRARALATGTRVDWAESVAVAQLIAESLAHVHDRRDPMGQPLAIVHRDLSPQNVMVAFTGEVKLIDFGTARGQNRRCHTVAGVVFAKPGYVAPEVANGDSGDFRVDLYALGVMLWELCASRRFLEGDASDHLAAVAAGKRDLPPVADSVGAPIELDAAIAKLTAHDREDRYGSARDAARDLATLLGSSLPVPGGERGVRPRVAALLGRLFPGETARFRRDFARLVENARKEAVAAAAAPPPPPSAPSAPSAAATETSAATDAAPADAAIDLSLPLHPDPPAPQNAEPVDASLLPGTRWRLIRALGRGATSVVWEAEHADVGRRAALKVHAGGEGGRSRFRIEARALARVEGPFVARMKEAGVASDGRPFTVTELLEGQTLDAWTKERAPLTPADVLAVGRKLLVSIEGLHATGLIHRDVKPENVFCCSGDGTVRMLDLGIARDLGEAEEQDPPSGGALALHGTPAYMAPEQASGVADERSDIYAVGCILYEMLAGSLPFAGERPGDGDVVGVLESKAKGSPEPLSERAANREIPEEIDALVMRALARHPSVRFQTAKAMREAIEDLERAPARKRSSRRRMGFGALAAAMAVGAALFAMPMFPQTAGVLARIKSAVSQPAPLAAAEAPQPTGLDALADAPPAGDGGDVLDLLPPEVADEERALRALEDAGDDAPDLADDAVADADESQLVRLPGEGEDHFGEGEAVAPKPQKKKRRAQKASPERDRQGDKGDKKAKPKGNGKADGKADAPKDKKTPKSSAKGDDKGRKKKKGKSRDAGVDG